LTCAHRNSSVPRRALPASPDFSPVSIDLTLYRTDTLAVNFLGFGPEVLNPDGKTLQFRYLSALAAKFIDNIRINIDNIRINVDDFPAKLVPLD